MYLVKKFSTNIEYKDLLLFSQELFTKLCFEPNEFSPPVSIVNFEMQGIIKKIGQQTH